MKKLLVLAIVAFSFSGIKPAVSQLTEQQLHEALKSIDDVILVAHDYDPHADSVAQQQKRSDRFANLIFIHITRPGMPADIKEAAERVMNAANKLIEVKKRHRVSDYEEKVARQEEVVVQVVKASDRVFEKRRVRRRPSARMVSALQNLSKGAYTPKTADSYPDEASAHTAASPAESDEGEELPELAMDETGGGQLGVDHKSSRKQGSRKALVTPQRLVATAAVLAVASALSPTVRSRLSKVVQRARGWWRGDRIKITKR